MDSSRSKLIECLCILQICANITGQSVKQELKKHDFIKALKLADTRMFDRYVNWIRYILGLCHWRNAAQRKFSSRQLDFWLAH